MTERKAKTHSGERETESAVGQFRALLGCALFASEGTKS
jgi:hypothetical protein